MMRAMPGGARTRGKVSMAGALTSLTFGSPIYRPKGAGKRTKYIRVAYLGQTNPAELKRGCGVNAAHSEADTRVTPGGGLSALSWHMVVPQLTEQPRTDHKHSIT